MKLKAGPWRMTALALVLAACGGGEPDAAAVADSAVMTSPAAAPVEADPLPPEPAAPAPPASAAPEAPAPTRADSLAAAREDVSPEWKQRERSMGGYARCMRQAEGADEPVRARLAEACARLPDAPR